MDKEVIFMSGLATVIRPVIRPGQRVLAISDIHGNLAMLKGVLAKVGFQAGDVLILVGDLLEKGQDSLAVLRYLMELSNTHTVYPLCGNCDHIDRAFLEGRRGADENLWPVFRFWGERALVNQLGAELGLPLPQQAADLVQLRQAIRTHYPRETDFLLGMPHILEAGNFIFVHGGVPREDRLEELDAYSCMKNDNFLGQDHTFHKWVVVGHWPVTLYHPDIPTARPFIQRDRHIVSIDGGCVLKLDGQLNALVIPDIYGDEMSHVAYDGLPVMVAADNQQRSSHPLNIRWNDSVVETLWEDGDCAWCRHTSSGRELWIPKGHLHCRRDGKLHCEDITDYRLPVAAGERLALVGSYDRGHLVKKHGMSGWYLGRLREPGEIGIQ